MAATDLLVDPDNTVDVFHTINCIEAITAFASDLSNWAQPIFRTESGCTGVPEFVDQTLNSTTPEWSCLGVPNSNRQR